MKYKNIKEDELISALNVIDALLSESNIKKISIVYDDDVGVLTYLKGYSINHISFIEYPFWKFLSIVIEFTEFNFERRIPLFLYFKYRKRIKSIINQMTNHSQI